MPFPSFLLTGKRMAQPDENILAELYLRKNLLHYLTDFIVEMPLGFYQDPVSSDAQTPL